MEIIRPDSDRTDPNRKALIGQDVLLIGERRVIEVTDKNGVSCTVINLEGCERVQCTTLLRYVIEGDKTYLRLLLKYGGCVEAEPSEIYVNQRTLDPQEDLPYPLWSEDIGSPSVPFYPSASASDARN